MEETAIDYASFLCKDAKTKIEKLQAEQKPLFGIMSPQHMVEHLIKTLKTSIKSYGDAPEKPTEKQENFMKFIFSDVEFRPSDPAKAKLEDLFYENLDLAKAEFGRAVDRFYAFFVENPEAKPYNPFFGSLNKTELERFHYKHVRHHLRQFNLI